MNKTLLIYKIRTILAKVKYTHIWRSLKSQNNNILYKELLLHTKFLSINVTVSERIHCLFHNIKSIQYCKECKIKEVKYCKNKKKYRIFCSPQCSNKNNDSKKNRELGILKKYGAKNIFQLDIFLEKRKKTYIKNYGVDNPMKNKNIKNKYILTNRTKYWVDNPMQSKIIQKKVVETNKNRYNAEYGLQNENIRIKINNTFKLNRNKWINNKLQYSLIKHNTLAKLYNTNVIYNNSKYYIICNKCNKKNLTDFTFFYNRLYIQKQTPCIKCLPLNHNISNMEKQFSEYIAKIYKWTMKTSDRKILDWKEIDILLTEANLWIEINWLYWHSDAQKEDKNYHLNKTELAKSKWIQLIHIFTDEIKQWMELIFSILSAKWYLKKLNNDDILALNTAYWLELNIPEKIYARKLILKSHNLWKRWEKKIYKDLLRNTHIQGDDNAKYYYSLEQKWENWEDDKILSILTFKKMSVDKNQIKSHSSKKHMIFELSRYVIIPWIQIIWGFQKLFKAFKRDIVDIYPEYKIDILTYSNLRYSDPDSNVYLRNWFEKIGFTWINYYYFYKWQKFHRFKFRKDQLYYKYLPENNIPVSDNYKEESERWMIQKMNDNWIPVNKIFDCWHIKWKITLI